MYAYTKTAVSNAYLSRPSFRLPPIQSQASNQKTSSLKSRIFLPKLVPQQKLPLIIYVHGGALYLGSPLNTVTQGFLTPLVSQTPAVAIAIGYRLALEHPLPAAYHDCWEAFQWIASHAAGTKGPEPWINDYVDMTRVFLVGGSAGANLAHYIAVQAGVKKSQLSIRALIALHPWFSHKEPDKLLQYLYPNSSCSDDDPKLNPCSDPDLEKMGCSKVLVVVAELDRLKPRGVGYKETLEKSKSGGKVEFMENEGEDHSFYLFDPSSEKAKGLSQALISFISQEV